MTSPEDAMARARERAAAKPVDQTPGSISPGLERSITSDRPSLELLSDWAVIEVDRAQVYSTRRAGAPITAVKRVLLRMLRQYHAELEARQTRFNIALLSQFRDLEERVTRLEARDAGREAPDE